MKRPQGPTGNETPSPAVNEQVCHLKHDLANQSSRPRWTNDNRESHSPAFDGNRHIVGHGPRLNGSICIFNVNFTVHLDTKRFHRLFGQHQISRSGIDQGRPFEPAHPRLVNPAVNDIQPVTTVLKPNCNTDITHEFLRLRISVEA